jgi:hypothetical protein
VRSWSAFSSLFFVLSSFNESFVKVHGRKKSWEGNKAKSYFVFRSLRDESDLSRRKSPPCE